MHRLPALLVVGLVVLSGCSAFVDTPGESNGSTTTTSSPTSTSDDGQRVLAPGITQAGIVNPVALMSAHQRELLDRGYVITETVRSTYDGSLSNRLVLVTTVGPGGEVAYQNGTSYGYEAGENVSVVRNAMWLNTTTMVTKHIEGGSTTYRILERFYPPEALVWFGSIQRDVMLAAEDYRVTDVQQRDGQRVVTLTATIDRVGGEGVNDTTSTLVVDETGVIRRASVVVEFEPGVRYRTTYRVERLGVSPPSPPRWLDSVPPSAALDVGMDVFEFDATSVQLVHTHGDAAPAGSIVSLVSNGTLYRTTLNESFGDGELYLWLSTDGTLRATRDRPAPSEARSLDTEITVTVRAPDGGELFSTSVGR